MGVYFVAGVYGVGKSTLCDSISKELGIPHVSASEVISCNTGEQYGKRKYVTNANRNQQVLINEIQRIQKSTPQIILSGHFCIFDRQERIECLPNFVYKELSMKKILLLEADIDRIVLNLKGRDQKKYGYESIKKLVLAERAQAITISQQLRIPLKIYTMTFNSSDKKECSDFIRGY
ncbi:MAG: AAA family ATPase [Mogibacterium sp.]|nr:AAA family ATPase [Mogibacterium sp.]